MSEIDLTPDWMDWKESAPSLVLAPETDYEGADMPLEPSERGPDGGARTSASGPRDLPGERRDLPVVLGGRRGRHSHREAERPLGPGLESACDQTAYARLTSRPLSAEA